MVQRKKKGNTVELVWRLAQPIAEELGLTLWDVRFVKEGASWFLRIFIDKDGGVGIEDCEAMSRAVNAPLDELNPIEQSYCLEVCSPGLERELTRDEHFRQCLGRPVHVRLIRPLSDGRRDLAGGLLGYENHTVTLRTAQGEELALEKSGVSSVRLAEEDYFGGMEQ